MSFLGLGGGAPSPPPPPPPPAHPPTMANAAVQSAAQSQQARGRRSVSGAGFSDTIKTGSLGAPKPATTTGAETLGG